MEEETQNQKPESAKEVASKYIGKYGLAYIVAIIAIGVGSSAWLSEAAITAVMTMIGGALVALISMLQGITGTREEEKPEFELMKDLVDRLDTKEEPMSVEIQSDKVVIKKGDDVITTDK